MNKTSEVSHIDNNNQTTETNKNNICNENRRSFLKNLFIITSAFSSSLSTLDIFTPSESIAESKSNKELLQKLFQKPELEAPNGEYNIKQINKWRNRYNGKDKKYIASDLKFKIQNGWDAIPIDQELREGWLRMVQNGDLQMIHKKCLQYKVPFDVVFLALGESHWKNRKSKFASGRWQFIPSTAKFYGLVETDKEGDICQDYRHDAELSTDAAMRLLKDNFQRTYYWDDKFNFSDKIIKKISNQDRWFYAMWQYNMSPNKVATKYGLLNGQAEGYALNQDNKESQSYVNKMIGIKFALKDQPHFLLSSIGEKTIQNNQLAFNEKQIDILHISRKTKK